MRRGMPHQHGAPLLDPGGSRLLQDEVLRGSQLLQHALCHRAGQLAPGQVRLLLLPFPILPETDPLLQYNSLFIISMTAVRCMAQRSPFWVPPHSTSGVEDLPCVASSRGYHLGELRHRRINSRLKLALK